MERHHERDRGDIDGMNIESQRVKSFENTSWPENTPVTIYRLANAGFYFTVIDDEVKCFSCLIIIRDWKQGDSPKGRHKRSSPRCRFVQGIDARNIADVKYVLKSGNSSKRLPLQHRNESNGKDCVTLLKDRANAGVEDKTACSKGYQFERNRLRTFQDFPLSCPVDPYELSASGFYMQNNYAVQCFACFVRIPYSSWKIGDRPINKHRVVSPSCPFVRGLVTGNQPLTKADKLIALRYNIHQKPQSEERVKIQHPLFTSIEARFASFNSWSHSRIVKPSDLANAGFFYSGEIPFYT